MTATLLDRTRAAGPPSGRRLCGIADGIDLDALASDRFLGFPHDRLRDRSILLATGGQFAAALALLAGDGLARRIVLCPPGLPAEHVGIIAAAAGIDLMLRDEASRDEPLPGIETLTIDPTVIPEMGTDERPAVPRQTEWVLLTSGTSGVPKMVKHTLDTLVGAMTGGRLGIGAVWSTFYDIRRYGGLQIFLRAMTGGGSMVLTDAGESVPAFLSRAAKEGVTHISGTPSHWRRALMAPRDARFAPDYVRLSGEIADQAILDALRAAFPGAAVSHAFASTEAGVAFDVADGLAGFPTSLVGGDAGVALRIRDGSLHIRSARTAHHYVGDGAPPLGDAEGFVDTGDMVELRGDRYHFVGRRSGIINVGGLKIHPEEVEAAIAGHSRVRMCLVKARKSPITGAIVTADVVADFDRTAPSPAEAKALEAEIVSLCQARLERHKVPVSIRFVPTLDIGMSGKMGR